MVERAVPGSAEWVELAAPHLARYLFATEWARGKRVLDAGTGNGYGAALLAYADAVSVLGIDNDPAAIVQAQQTYGHIAVSKVAAPNSAAHTRHAFNYELDCELDYEVDDCETLARAAGPYDLICNFENIEHLPHPEKFLAEAAKRLAPDGVLLISTPDRAVTPPFIDGKPRNPYHCHEWYRDEFHDLLAHHFANIEMRVQVLAAAQQARMEAVESLRQALMWSNPLTLLLWRKWPFAGPKAVRPWKKLAGLAAASPTDYPIVALSLASLLGASWFHVAICRQPRQPV